ncbi:hypothetical protein GCM10023189_15840 [Nibrella saemangeumensis]|uniref:Secretion system C-terminal sorting domain-containing protein n=1 Tax=Nibrella saemangeumensis TaxID=1084526 RepID=A0ABP8MPN4_9BACT
MKKTVIPLLIGLGLPALGMAQRLMPSVVANAGGYDQNSQLALEWTLGETFVETVSRPDRIYTQGFHQPMLSVEELPQLASPYRIRISPNPVVAVLNIAIEAAEDTRFQLNLTDLTGRTLYSKPAEGRLDALQVDMKDLPAGVYILQVATPEGRPARTVKVVKQ